MNHQPFNIVILLLATLLCAPQLLPAQPASPEPVWNPNLPGGRYRNPIIHADLSDPDVCRVDSDYYMTASSFNAMPGLPILHSRDLVNWSVVAYALTDHYPVLPEYRGTTLDYRVAPQHGRYVWAPAIRHHDGWFYIYWGDPDQGLFMVKAHDVCGPWTEPVLVKAGKGLIDCCPLWDDDGSAWLAHGCAGSRAGMKSVIFVAPLSPDGTHVTGPSRIVYDGHETQPTIEGAKLYKRNGYYYIFSPAGGVKQGWQVELRSRDIYGPYEERVALAQGHTHINGPHQGAWVDATDGSQWFIHFQDKQAYGRVVHLQPARWHNGWLEIGKNGEPVETGRKLEVGEDLKSGSSEGQKTDNFSSTSLGLQWQWEGPWSHYWYFCDARNSRLRLYGPQQPEYFNNLSDLPNVLLQKFPAEQFVVTARLRFIPNNSVTATPFAKNDSTTTSPADGEEGGFVIMGLDYAGIKIVKDGSWEDRSSEVQNTDNSSKSKGLRSPMFNVQSSKFKVNSPKFNVQSSKFKVQFVVCHDAQEGGREVVTAERTIKGEALPVPYTRQYGGDALTPPRIATPWIYVRVKVWSTGEGTAIRSHAQFSWSDDNKHYEPLGQPFDVREGKWVGAKFGFYCSRAAKGNDAPFLDVDWVRVEKPNDHDR